MTISITTRILLILIQAPLAFVFLASATTKLAQSKARLAKDVPWARNYSARQLNLLGLAELSASYGLVLPTLMNVAPVLAPLAALGMVMLMIGATHMHVRRREWRWAGFTSLLLSLLVGVLVSYVRIIFQNP